MNLSIRLFATLKDRAGASQVCVELREPCTVKELLAAVAEKYPALEPSMKSILISVNWEFAERAQTLGPADEIALFPPVSGG